MKQFKNNVETVVGTFEQRVGEAVRNTERIAAPYRESLFKRFPIFFTLAVTFGLVTTFYGFERMISLIPWLNDRPLLILMIGLMTLALTGTLYKKLG